MNAILWLKFPMYDVNAYMFYVLVEFLCTKDSVIVHMHVVSMIETWSRGDQVHIVEVPVM